jgi:hypothetical protein
LIRSPGGDERGEPGLQRRRRRHPRADQGPWPASVTDGSDKKGEATGAVKRPQSQP